MSSFCIGVKALPCRVCGCWALPYRKAMLSKALQPNLRYVETDAISVCFKIPYVNYYVAKLKKTTKKQNNLSFVFLNKCNLISLFWFTSVSPRYNCLVNTRFVPLSMFIVYFLHSLFLYNYNAVVTLLQYAFVRIWFQHRIVRCCAAIGSVLLRVDNGVLWPFHPLPYWHLPFPVSDMGRFALQNRPYRTAKRSVSHRVLACFARCFYLMRNVLNINAFGGWFCSANLSCLHSMVFRRGLGRGVALLACIGRCCAIAERPICG